MLITIKDIIELEEFNGSKIIAGYNGINNIVDNVLLMEVPDILPYVYQNNLLITTLYPISNNEEAMNTIIPNLAKLNLAGICIKPARYIKEVPQIMIEQGNKFDFPIIELPEGANLSFLITSFLKLSLKNHIDILSFRNHVHENLMELFLTGADINLLVNSLSELVNKPVILLDNYMDIVHQSVDVKNEIVIVKTLNESISIKVNDYTYDNKSYILHPIKAGETQFGYLLLLDCTYLENNYVLAMEQGALLIASAFYKNYAVMEKERSFQVSFIKDILSGKISSQLESINKARSFGWMMEFPQVVIVIKVFNGDDKDKLQIYEEIIESNLESIVSKKLYISQNKIKMVYLDDSLVVFINSIFMNNVKYESIMLGQAIVNRFLKYDISIGISNSIFNITGFPEGYNEAHISAKIGYILNKSNCVSHFDDYQIFNILKEVNNSKILEDFVKDKIGKVIDHDNLFKTDFLSTIKTLIEENMNLKKTSEKLFIHYNTLRYRLEKLKEIGIDFDSNVDIAGLSLAITAHHWLSSI